MKRGVTCSSVTHCEHVTLRDSRSTTHFSQPEQHEVSGSGGDGGALLMSWRPLSEFVRDVRNCVFSHGCASGERCRMSHMISLQSFGANYAVKCDPWDMELWTVLYWNELFFNYMMSVDRCQGLIMLINTYDGL